MNKKQFKEFMESKEFEMRYNSIQNSLELFDAYLKTFIMISDNVRDLLDHIDKMREGKI